MQDNRSCRGRAAGAAGLLGLGLFSGAAQAVPVVALNDEDTLLVFDSAAPEDILTGAAVTGLAPNDDLIGIDVRPADGQLYGVGTGSGTAGSARVYRIDSTTGAAVQVSTLNTTLSGTRFGFDFNPVPDRLRIVSDTDQNLRVNVDTGATTVDTPLQYGPGQSGATGDNPNVAGAGYTNSFPPSPRTPPPGTTLVVRHRRAQQ